MYIMDKLYESVAERGHVCVGLDTAPSYLPPAELKKNNAETEAVLAYNKALIDATLDVCACYKVQIAYYEAMGLAGLAVYAQTLRYIRAKNALVIGDIKRGDIADTAAQYAKAHFTGEFEADFVTLSPYMGMDSLEPWLAYAENAGKGAFVLMRTSNKGMKDFEYLEIKQNEGGSPPLRAHLLKKVAPYPPNGGQAPRNAPLFAGNAPAPNRRLYNAVGDKLAETAAKYAGKYGYGAFGAVAGCTETDEAQEIRRNYENLFFLIPGYGAQGGGAEGAALFLQNGNGGVVNASRSILTAWKKYGEENADIETASQAARQEAISMRDAIRKASHCGNSRYFPAKECIMANNREDTRKYLTGDRSF